MEGIGGTFDFEAEIWEVWEHGRHGRFPWTQRDVNPVKCCADILGGDSDIISE